MIFDFASININIFSTGRIVADAFLTDPLQVVAKNNLQFDMSSKYKDRLVELHIHKIYSAGHFLIIYIIFLHIIGVNMKKWCILQSRIKSGATDEVCKDTFDTVGFTDISQLHETRKWKDSHLYF